jgi:chemotaxis protein MotD
MNRLSGTPAQLFSVIAETIKPREAVRSGKGGPGGQQAQDSSFHDLLHSVSNRARQASSQQADEDSARPEARPVRVTQLPQGDEVKDETVHKRSGAVEQPASSDSSRRLDQAANADAQARPALPTLVGPELTVLSAQAQPHGGTSGAAAGQAERPLTGRDLSLARALGEQGAASGKSVSALAPQESAGKPAAVSFENSVAGIEHATKFAGREVLPEATRVTVLQQETHLPPVPQFTATQQVANAVVAELKGSPSAASSAASDLAMDRSNAPDQPLRILTISLDPPALGNVTVRLRLTGDAVSLHLAAERRDTSQMLDQQRDSIRDLMRSAGYVADVAPVRQGTMDGLQAGSGQPQPSFSGQHQASTPQGGPDGFNPSLGQPQGGQKQARQEREPNQEMSHEQVVVSHGRRGDIYL